MNPSCRICHAELSGPLLTLNNVPAAAQNLPASPEELAADLPVDLNIHECPRCGVVQHSAAPVGYFREVLRASGVSEAMRKFRLEQFADWLKKYDLSGKRVFEAGCGRGEYLALMAQAGADVTGWEYGQSAVDFCRKQNINAERGFFETGSEIVGSGNYDGFFVLNFLEHIPDLARFLDGCRRNLRPGGAGLVEVPNFDMILKNSLLTEFSTEHLYYFTEKSLCNLLESNGFEVRQCRSIWSDYIISAEVVKRETVSLAGCSAVLENIKDGLDKFITPERKVAFWGAGHQALTTLALLDYQAEDIAFVIDSSPDKQDRFTYATHIPIVSPARLDDGELDAVVIACGGYSDEVAAQIRSRYGNRFSLAVLRENGVEVLQ